MSNLRNQVQLIGNVGNTPEIKNFESETIYVSIPQGIDHGEMLEIPKKGASEIDRGKGDSHNCMEVYGDSYTESVGVNYKNSWPSLLSQKINCMLVF